MRWDPHREDEIFFNQSVALYTEYYNIQILIHKPFIPSPRNTSPLTFPSLAICTNAARSCSHIVDIQRQRGFLWGQSFSAVRLSFVRYALSHSAVYQLNAFAAAIVLLLNIWGGKRSRMNLNPVKEMLDVHKCMQVLRDMENTYVGLSFVLSNAKALSLGTISLVDYGKNIHIPKSYRFTLNHRDILFQLASVGNLPLPEFDPSATAKRRRDDDDVPTTTDQCTSQSFSTGYQAQASTSEPSPPQSYQSTSYSTDPVFNGYPMSSSTTIPNGNGLWLMPQDSDVFDIPLPMHSSDLGRMPLHPPATLPNRDVPLATSSANAAWPYSDMTQEPYAFGLSQPKDPINAVVDDATFALWANAPGGLESVFVLHLFCPR